MNPDFWLNLVMAVCAGAGVYAAIRVDLVTAKIRAEQAVESAKEAHGRIDLHINEHSNLRAHHGN